MGFLDKLAGVFTGPLTRPGLYDPTTGKMQYFDSPEDAMAQANQHLAALPPATISENPVTQVQVTPADTWQSRYAKPNEDGSYMTSLAPPEEQQFQSWVKQNRVPWQDSPTADYDMRGYWKAQQAGNPNAAQSRNVNDGEMHFPDTWKTPYHKSFSGESQYSTGQGAPQWINSHQLADSQGNVLFDERQPDVPGPMQAPTLTPQNGGISVSAQQSKVPAFIKAPTYQQASTDPRTGMPTPLNPAQTKLSKFLSILHGAAQGAMAGRAASEQAVVASGGHRNGGFATGFQAAQEEPYRQAAMRQQVQQGALQTQMAQAQMQQMQTPVQYKGQSVPYWMAQRQMGMDKEMAAVAKDRFMTTRDGRVWDNVTQSYAPGSSMAGCG